MKRSRSLTLALGLALFACQAQEADQQAEMEEPAAVDTEAIRTTIADGSRQWAAAVNAGDAEALTNLYADDAVIYAPDWPTVTGRSEISAFFNEMVSEGPVPTTLTTDDVIIAESGDLAIETGSFTDPNGAGKYVTVWRNVDGDWKIGIDAWNMNGSVEAGAE
ncbi:MAG: YybH family protein [Gemmatimonadota bacterium]